MILFNDDSKSRFIGYNRNFDQVKVIAGYPGGLNSWLKPTTRLDAAGNGALAVASDSDYPVNDYLIKHCTNTCIPGGVYVKSWYTGSLNDGDPHFEFVGDVCGGFGIAPNNPLYSIYLYESGMVPPNQSLHRIESPYNEPTGVIRSYVPLRDTISGTTPPYGVSHSFFVAMAVDDKPAGEANPMVAYVYTAENRVISAMTNEREIDVWNVNFADPHATEWVRTLPSIALGGSVTPGLENPRIVDIAVLPASATNMYMGDEKFADHNWLVVLYHFSNYNHWFIEIFDVQSELPPPNSWSNVLYWILPVQGKAFALDVDPVNFEIYVLHDDGPLGAGELRLTCYEYY